MEWVAPIHAFGRSSMSVRARFLTVAVAALAVTGQALVTVPAAPAGATDDGSSTTPTWGPVKRLARNPRGESLVVV